MSWGKVCARAESMAQSQWWGRKGGVGGVQGQSSQGVEHPDCLAEESGSEPVGLGPEILQSPPQQQQAGETARWVGSPAVPVASTGEAGVVNVQKEVKRDTADLLSCSHSAAEEMVQVLHHTVMQLVRMPQWCLCRKCI